MRAQPAGCTCAAAVSPLSAVTRSLSVASSSGDSSAPPAFFELLLTRTWNDFAFLSELVRGLAGPLRFSTDTR